MMCAPKKILFQLKKVMDPVPLVSRYGRISSSTRKETVLDTLKKYFQVGAEKSIGAQKYRGVCPLNHVPIADLLHLSIFSLGKEMIKKGVNDIQH